MENIENFALAIAALMPRLRDRYGFNEDNKTISTLKTVRYAQERSIVPRAQPVGAFLYFQ